MSKKGSKAEWLNELTENVQYLRFKNVALNTFEWKGLPDTIQPWFIERLLFDFGRAIFFEDKELGVLCLQCGDNGQFNIYGEPQKLRAIGYNYNKEYDITDDKCVEIKNNKMRIPTNVPVMWYVNKLTQIERTLDVHLENLKIPFIMVTDEKTKLSAFNFINQRQNNEPVIFVPKDMALSEIQFFDSRQDIFIDKLADYYHDVENKLLTFLGINNSNTDKKERLITDEVNSNNDFIEANCQYMLESRQEAVERINKMFGLNITVDLKQKPKEPTQQSPDEGSEE